MKPAPRLQMDILEDRLTPATFGIPLIDPMHTTISFVPDGTDVGGTPSNLFQTLNQTSTTTTWQRDILRAAQTWSSLVNINIGVVSDDGSALGTQDPISGSKPFGVIRIAAKPMASNVLAIGIPPNEFGNSSWASDIIFNSNANLSTQRTDLYTVFLHEMGHALGLGGSSDTRSVMFQTITGKRLGLAASDLLAVGALYGTRLPDVNEKPGKGNETPKLAAEFKYEDTGPDAWTGETPLLAFGDITRNTDVDVYKFDNLDSYSGPISFRLLSKGISLLNARLSLVDSKGKVLQYVVGQDLGGNDINLTLPASVPGGKYYVRVESSFTTNGFSVGRYGLALSLGSLVTTPQATITSTLQGPYDTLEMSDVDKLFSTDPEDALFAEDDSTDDSQALATRLLPMNSLNTAFTGIGSLQLDTDVDFYRLRIPRLTTNNLTNLTMTVTPYSVNGVMPEVQVLNKQSQPVAVTLLSNGDGVIVLQASNLKANDDYFIRIANAPGQAVTGNYQLQLRMSRSTTTLNTFLQGTVPATGSSTSVYVAQPQLFHLLLSTNNGVTATLQIENLSGQIVYSLTTTGTPTSSAPLLLQPGEYRVKLTTPSGQPTVVTLRGDIISDPIGSVVVNPNQTPIYTNPGGGYTYPGGTTTSKPYFWLALAL